MATHMLHPVIKYHREVPADGAENRGASGALVNRTSGDGLAPPRSQPHHSPETSHGSPASHPMGNLWSYCMSLLEFGVVAEPMPFSEPGVTLVGALMIVLHGPYACIDMHY